MAIFLNFVCTLCMSLPVTLHQHSKAIPKSMSAGRKLAYYEFCDSSVVFDPILAYKH